MRGAFWMALLATVFLATSGSTEDSDGGGADATEGVANGGARFAFDLYGRLCKEEGNIFFSPWSISEALVMTYLGARGETEAEMAAVLHLPVKDVAGADQQRELVARGFDALRASLAADRETTGYELRGANALWGQKGFSLLESFLGMTRKWFGASVESVDFRGDSEGARRAINAWAKLETDGYIEELVRPGDLDPLVRIVLTNAIYFKGSWQYGFDEADTRPETFHRRPGDPEGDVVVPMMHRKAKFRYAKIEHADATLLELPYQGARLAMLVLLPGEEAQALSGLENRLSADSLDAWIGRLREREVVVALPKFQMRWGTVDLKPYLVDLGMAYAFGADADFSGIDGARDLFISSVLHQAFVAVNEEGTEAAAATAVVGRLIASLPTLFRADRPFLFLIRDVETGAVLFMGRVSDPSL